MADTQAPNPDTAAPSHLDEVQTVARRLHALLDGCETARLKPEIKAGIERLNALTDTYLAGLGAAQALSQSGTDALMMAQKELSLSLEEYLRLEDEGGNPATPEQEDRTDSLASALRRIQALIPAFDGTFSDPTLPPEPEIPPESEPEGAPRPPQELPPEQQPGEQPDLLPEIPPASEPKF